MMNAENRTQVGEHNLCLFKVHMLLYWSTDCIYLFQTLYVDQQQKPNSECKGHGWELDIYNNSNRLFMVSHLVRARSIYKDIKIHSFHQTHTHARTHARMHTHTHTHTHTHLGTISIGSLHALWWHQISSKLMSSLALLNVFLPQCKHATHMSGNNPDIAPFYLFRSYVFHCVRNVFQWNCSVIIGSNGFFTI